MHRESGTEVRSSKSTPIVGGYTLTIVNVYVIDGWTADSIQTFSRTVNMLHELPMSAAISG